MKLEKEREREMVRKCTVIKKSKDYNYRKKLYKIITESVIIYKLI